jgi:methylenetetrahydrofolate dehydrogenase (NADP+)/methenyltetrahydrofolate cyclohydrolase
MKYIDCEKYAKEILDEVKQVKHTKYFAIVSVGDNPASQSYIKGKIKDCEYCGIPYVHKNINPEMEGSKVELEVELLKLGRMKDVAAIILQLPLPKDWDEEYFSNLIPPEKDVDGLVSNSSFLPCTPEGIVHVLKKELGSLEGKTALIIGRGKLVGRPLFDLLLSENCTVTMAHSKTKDLLSMLLLGGYDIVVVATGRPKLVNLQLLNRNTKIVIDAGVNRVEGKLCGDCHRFDKEIGEVLVTPVPKGIGLMTRAMLMEHIAEINKKASES